MGEPFHEVVGLVRMAGARTLDLGPDGWVRNLVEARQGKRTCPDGIRYHELRLRMFHSAEANHQRNAEAGLIRFSMIRAQFRRIVVGFSSPDGVVGPAVIDETLIALGAAHGDFPLLWRSSVGLPVPKTTSGPIPRLMTAAWEGPPGSMTSAAALFAMGTG